MPKIRKKTSKRTTTHTREKVKKKVAEAKRKQKKAAKKDVTWKSKRKEQDLGIPSKFPFKDQILAEVAQAKNQRELEKQLRREQQKAAHQAASLGLADPATVAEDEDLDGDSDDFETDDSMDEDDDGGRSDGGATAAESSSSLKLHARSLRDVISKSDVIVQVLDARDPEGTRSRKIEREAVQVHGKKLVLVLNKIDLVPKENAEAWLKHLRLSFPTLPFKSSTQSQRNNLSSGNSSHTPAGASSSSPAPLLTLLKNYSRSGSLTAGVIGFPNVGKSSLINTLKRSRACAVAPTPGFTKEIQVISLDGKLNILDCPGVVYEGGDQGPEKVLRNCVAVEQIDDPIAPVEIILRKSQKEHLMMLYNIPVFSDTRDFLIAVARVRGRLQKGGIPDLSGTARMVLRDWNAGRIPYYTVPPATSTAAAAASSSSTMRIDNDVGSASIVSSLAPEFDLDSLFKEADSSALASASASSTSAVRMSESIAIDETSDVQLLDSTALANGKSKGKKRTLAPEVAEDTHTTAPPKKGKQKRVAFEDDAAPQTYSPSENQMAKLFPNPDEAPIQLNKSIKQQVKKDKKSKAKAERRTTKSVDAAVSAFAASSIGSMNVDGSSKAGPKPYDFSQFFGGSETVPDQDEDM